VGILQVSPWAGVCGTKKMGVREKTTGLGSGRCLQEKEGDHACGPTDLLVPWAVIAVDLIICVVLDALQCGPTTHHLQNIAGEAWVLKDLPGVPSPISPVPRSTPPEPQPGLAFTCP
jgi:hypothetical protein